MKSTQMTEIIGEVDLKKNEMGVGEENGVGFHKLRAERPSNIIKNEKEK